jgi:uncharacterized protein YdaU (DUF1376 family)
MTAPSSKPVQRLPWMPFYCADYFSATRALTLAQRGALIDLLALSWISGSLPPDTDRLAAMVGATPSEFRQIWPTISSWWIETPDHLLINAELEQRRIEARNAYEGRAAAGRASAAKRKSSRGAVSDPRRTAVVEEEEL